MDEIVKLLNEQSDMIRAAEEKVIKHIFLEVVGRSVQREDAKDMILAQQEHPKFRMMRVFYLEREIGDYTITYNDEGKFAIEYNLFKRLNMTITEKQDKLAERFGNQFYNELGARATAMQELQGRRKYSINSNSLVLANQVTEQLWKEWIVDKCEEEKGGEHLWHFDNESHQQYCLNCRITYSEYMKHPTVTNKPDIENENSKTE